MVSDFLAYAMMAPASQSAADGGTSFVSASAQPCRAAFPRIALLPAASPRNLCGFAAVAASIASGWKAGKRSIKPQLVTRTAENELGEDVRSGVSGGVGWVVQSFQSLNWQLYAALLVKHVLPTAYTMSRIYFLGQLPGGQWFGRRITTLLGELVAEGDGGGVDCSAVLLRWRYD